MKNILSLKTVALYFALLASFFVSTHAFALQEAAPYTKAIRYDVGGRVTGTIAPDPDGSGPLSFLATRNTYNATTGVLERTETGWLSTWLNESYDPQSWSGFNITSTKIFTYDEYGRAVSTALVGSDARVASLTEVNYDDKNRVLCKAQRLNTVSPQGNPCVGTQGVTPDRISKYTYNDFDLLVTEERAVGTALAQTYVKNLYAGRLLAGQTDANGNFTNLGYDEAFRLSHVFYPSKTVRGAANYDDFNEYKYDANNNKIFERKRNGAVINYTFDNNNRVIFKDLVDNTKAQDVAYNYDLRGLMLSARFGSDTGFGIANTFDGFGNLRSTYNSMSLANPSQSNPLYYSYDLNNNRTSIGSNYDLTYFTYAFDGLNRVNELKGAVYVGAKESLLTVNYSQDGRRKNIIRAGGATTTYNYANGLRLSDFSQTFTTPNYNVTNSFEYNNAGQITGLFMSSSLYHFKGNSNRTGNYVVNGLNQYTNAGGANPGTGQQIDYDNNANLNSDGNFTYVYDDENRLVGATAAVQSIKLTYDPLGRLFESDINNPGGRKKIQYLYDGDALIAEFDALNNNTLLRRYVHGDQVDEPWLQFYKTNTVSVADRIYLHADHQGSIIALSNGSGAVTNALAYDNYGTLSWSGSFSFNFRFGYTGQIYFPEMNLWFYKSRLYSPPIGRFLQTDKIGYADGMNMYAAMGNDPINNRDPSGLKCEGSGSDSKCTVDQVNIGTKKDANWVSRADGIKSGRVTEKQLGKLEGNITKGYVAAQKLGDNSVTIKGAGGVKDISVTGNQVAGALGKATLRADNQTLFDRPRAIASTAPDYVNGGSVTFNNRAFQEGNSAQTQTTVHEGLHLLEETRQWNDNSKYREAHQSPFGDAAQEIIGE
jgi:RHS repeat-associated protein